MGGILSVIFWAVAAVLASFGCSIPLQWTFWLAGSAAVLLVSFRMWQKLEEEKARAAGEIKALSDKLQMTLDELKSIRSGIERRIETGGELERAVRERFLAPPGEKSAFAWYMLNASKKAFEEMDRKAIMWQAETEAYVRAKLPDLAGHFLRAENPPPRHLAGDERLHLDFLALANRVAQMVDRLKELRGQLPE